jgi:hypothetical protein
MPNLSDYVALQSGIPESPTDGFVYGRRGQDGSWQVVNTKVDADAAYAPIVHTHPYVGLTGNETIAGEKQFDNNISVGVAVSPSYGLSCAGSINLGSGSNYFINGAPIETFVDAPLDGEIYGRQNGNWVLISIDGGTVTNLSTTYSTNFISLINSGGQDTTIAAATTSLAGVMTNADKQKVDAAITAANLSLSKNSTSNTINNDAGTGVSLSAATASVAGLMTASQKTALDNAVTSVNLSTSYGTSSFTIRSDEGADATVSAATGSLAGAFSAVDKLTLDAAQQDRILGINHYSTTVQLRRLGTSPTDWVFQAATQSTAGVMTASDKQKLDGLGAFALLTIEEQVAIISHVESMGGISAGRAATIEAQVT